MPESMQIIKRRIRSIESTRKITNAMELVANSKLRKVRYLLEQFRPYDQTVRQMVCKILEASEELIENEYLYDRSHVLRTAYIVITSSLGLCGGYNNNVLKLAHKEIKKNDYVFCIGTKGLFSFKNKKYNLNENYVELNNSLDFIGITSMIKELEEMYRNHEIGHIKIIYTEFINNLTFIPKIKSVLPLSDEIKAEFKSESSQYKEIIFEPNVMEVLKQLIPTYLNALTYGYLIESVTSENAARRLSMEKANENADELLEQLLLKYNQARQTAITNEISEVIAGASANS
jgi:ATP synthase, F1 gamma subunit